mgnify:FL=1
MQPPDRISCYNFRVVDVVRIVDGDTLDVVFDLGFDILKRERIRVAGIDTPEKRTRDLEEKALGIEATEWMQSRLQGVSRGDATLVIRTEKDRSAGKYGRLLGWLYLDDDTVSLNEKIIEEGYAWEYEGGKKEKDFEILRATREAYSEKQKIVVPEWH